MAYDEKLAERIRKVLGGKRKGITEKKMFGGIAWLLDGKMFVGIAKGELMVRVGPDEHDKAMAKPNVRPMDFTGRPMKGYVFVKPAGIAKDAALAAWVDQAAEHAATLPAKKPKKKTAKPKK